MNNYKFVEFSSLDAASVKVINFLLHTPLSLGNNIYGQKNSFFRFVNPATNKYLHLEKHQKMEYIPCTFLSAAILYLAVLSWFAVFHNTTDLTINVSRGKCYF